MNFVKTPHLPKGNVKDVIMSGEYKYLRDRICAFGINVIETVPVDALAKPVRCHADMQYLHLGLNKVMMLNEVSLSPISRELIFDINKLKKQVSEKYPGDVLLNCAIICDKIFLNRQTIDENVLEIFLNRNKKVIDVRQGYTKCSIAIVNEHAIITADESIYSAAISNNIDVLKISVGNILLPGYDYGFIGGCCGYINNDTLAFTGSLELHPDYYNIKAFLSNYHKRYVSLTNDNMIDIGGILPITEE